MTIDVQYEDVEDLKAIHSALKFGVEAGLTNSGILSVTVDSELGSSPATTFTNLAGWINQYGQPVTWLNASGQAIQWLSGQGYYLYKGDAQQYGKYLGLTVTSNGAGMTLNTLEIEHELRARF